MWIFTTFGFFSVVQKPGEELLCVRARSAADLDRLRGAYLPGLHPTQVGGGTDYPYRAHVDRTEFAGCLADIVRDLSYPNFKSAVSNESGHERGHTYHKVWAALCAVENEHDAAPVAKAPKHKPPPGVERLAYGGVLLRSDRIHLRRPTNDFGGYTWTFAKGGAEGDEGPEQAALREVRSETGIEAEIVGDLEGWFVSGLSATRFFVMRVIEEHGDWDPKETEAVEWVPLREAARWISQTTNRKGRERDLAVLESVLRLMEGED